MKLQTEKQFEGGMRFFTPELYLQFNSPDDEGADRANQAWEKALQAYQRHVDAFRHRMPSPIRKLTELCLHDWELLAFHEQVEPSSGTPRQSIWPHPIWSAVAALTIRQERQVTILFYILWDRVRQYTPRQPWPFSKKRKHWLYDELDEVPEQRGLFLQRILFSDGNVMEIPFVSSFIQTFPLQVSERTGKSRKTA